MPIPNNNTLSLPIELADYAYQNKLIKPLAILYYIKFNSNGKVLASSNTITQLKIQLQITDNRTFKKHIAQLIKLNWLGFDCKSGIFFTRSTKEIRLKHNFKIRQAVKVILADLYQFQIFLASVIITKEIDDIKFVHEVKNKRKPKEATHKWEVAKHSRVFSNTSKPPYYGLSNLTIAKLLNCSQTRACEIKHEAVLAGYLTTGHRYADLMNLQKADFKIKVQLYLQYPNLKGKIKFWRKWDDRNVKFIKLVIQLHDEIKSHIAIQQIEKLCHLKLSFEIHRGIANNLPKAA